MFVTLLNYCRTVTAFLDYPSFPIGYYNSRFHDNELWNLVAAEGYPYIHTFLRVEINLPKCHHHSSYSVAPTDIRGENEN